MTRYNLPGVPNQTFSVQVGGIIFNFSLRLFRGSMFVDIDNGENRILSGERVVRGIKLLPREWSDLAKGNFEFEIIGSGYPTYDMFGTGYAYLVFKEYGED